MTILITACGGGGGSSPSAVSTMGDDQPTSDETLIDGSELPSEPDYVTLTGIPSNHGLSPIDSFTVQPGTAVEQGYVEFRCSSGQSACVVRVTSDGIVEYKTTGGRPSTRSTFVALTGVPSNHGLTPIDPFAVQPGAEVEYGNVEFWCSSFRPTCIVRVTSDGVAEYKRSGGRPIVRSIYLTLNGVPSYHGLSFLDRFTIQPGAVVVHGEVEFSCSNNGPACELRVSLYDRIEYAKTGGVPTARSSFVELDGVPMNHDLYSLTTFTVQPGVTVELGNVEFSCPAGGPVCNLRISPISGNVEYLRSGGVPTAIAIYVSLTNYPSNHGLSLTVKIKVQPGATEKRGNVNISCPTGGQPCELQVASDNSIEYRQKGGIPSVTTSYMALTGIPSNHGLSMITFTIQPGFESEQGNVTFACPAGGTACVLRVASDGSVEYAKTGGTPSVAITYTALTGIPSNHGLSMTTFTVQPGSETEQGNVMFSCPAGGAACVLRVASDGSVEYAKTGGTPSVAISYMALTGIPSNHGLSMATFTIQPGSETEQGNVTFSCPASGAACVLRVASDGSVEYAKTGGTPSVMPIYITMVDVPSSHGLSLTATFTVQAGTETEQGNLKYSCPSAGLACVVRVASDGSVEYAKTGGVPSATPVYADLAGIPSNHGLSMTSFTIQPGSDNEQGNVTFSCPSGGSACVLRIASDGSVEYAKTGGTPSVMPIYITMVDVPSKHGLSSMVTFTVQSGTETEQGNLKYSCPSAGLACVVRVASDGSVEYAKTGGVPSATPVYADLTGIPSNHGLSMTTITIQPGSESEQGNVSFSCPSGGVACILRIESDGSVEYAKTGGTPTVMPIYITMSGIPSNHGLSTTTFTIQPGTEAEQGNLRFSCPTGGLACVVRVTRSGRVEYAKTGGAPSAILILVYPLPNVTGSGQFVGGRHYSTAHVSIEADHVRHSPVYSHGSYLHVGVDQGSSNIGSLSVAGSRGDIKIRHGQLSDGVGSTTLSSYLSGGIGSTVRRWESAPTIRVIGAASARDIEDVMAAVQLVNAALPEGVKMQAGSPLPDFSQRDAVDSRGLIYWSRYNSSGVHANTIHVEFIPSGDFYSTAGATTWNRSTSAGLQNSYIQFNQGANVYRDGNSRRRVILLAHEIMHAVGIYGNGHPSSSFDTIMEGTGDIYELNQGIQQPRSLLYPVDREALQALYLRLDNGENPTTFGTWASTSWHIVGNGPYAHFGVALRNGYAEPWAYGHRPNTNLSSNTDLSGTVTWRGTLLGLTLKGSVVAGDAVVDVNLSTLNGNANFTNLESWTANTAPGDAGTGTQWLDGDLGYTIVVNGNTFHESGGDVGRITGIFTGHEHEGAAGTLMRADLTAAFGTSRK